MQKPTAGSYMEEGYAPTPVFFDSDVYGTILDGIVVACVDIAATHNGALLLGKRTHHPQADWWIVGGRMQPGDALAPAAQRLFRKEMGVQIPEERFSYLTTFVCGWKKRAHPPEDNGAQALSAIMTIELTDEEADRLVKNDEYSEIAWRPIAKISQENSLHPAIRQVASTLL